MASTALHEVLVSIVIQVSLLAILGGRRHQRWPIGFYYIGRPGVALGDCMKDPKVDPDKLYPRLGSDPDSYVVC